MNQNLDTLLTALYVELDDRALPALGFSRKHHPGRKPRLNDVELLCLVVAQQLLGFSSERHWVRFAHAYLSGMFPAMPQQSGYSKRVRAADGLIASVIPFLAHDVESWQDTLRLLDSTPIPCGSSRETVRRSDLAGKAGYGYCAANSRWFWGFRLYLVCTAEGMPVVWGLASPKIGERAALTELLADAHHEIRPGQILVGDKGFAGREFETFIHDELHAEFVRPDRRDETQKHGNLARIRQWVEAIFDTLKGQLTLEAHGGRTLTGVHARIGARLLALAAAIWHNWHTGAHVKRSLIAYDT